MHSLLHQATNLMLPHNLAIFFPVCSMESIRKSFCLALYLSYMISHTQFILPCIFFLLMQEDAILSLFNSRSTVPEQNRSDMALKKIYLHMKKFVFWK